MGRYKSVLMAEQDARDFPHHVLVPVPPNGLGKANSQATFSPGTAIDFEY